MKIAVVSLALFLATCVVAAPQGPVAPIVPPAARFAPGAFVPIVSQNFDISPDGSYAFQYASADGSSRQETGALKNPGTVAESNSVSGSYSYIADDGTPVTVNYIADENGFQPEGNTINPAITRSVAAQVQEAAAFRAGVVPVPLSAAVRPPVVPVPAATVAPVIPPRVLPGAYNPAIYNPAVYNPAYNPGVYNPAVYNPAVYNPAAYNPAAYNPAAYNPAYYRGYPGYRGYPYYNPAFPNRVFPTPIPTPTPTPVSDKA